MAVPAIGGALIAAGGALAVAETLRRKAEIAEEWRREHGALPAAATKTEVAIYQQNTDGASEFASYARRLRDQQGYAIYPVTSQAQLQDVLRQHNTYDRLILIGHGFTTHYFTQGYSRISVTPQWLAQQLTRRTTRNTIIGLAGCHAGRSPGEAMTQEVVHRTGGADSFAGILRDRLVEGGAAQGGEVRAHTTRGHTSRNPDVRRFPIMAAAVGQGGLYTQVAQGNDAEAWISGLAGCGLGDLTIPMSSQLLTVGAFGLAGVVLLGVLFGAVKV